MILLSSLSESTWAEHGIIGLVLFALFLLIGSVITIFIKTLNRKDDKHTDFLKTMLDEHAEERKVDREDRKEDRTVRMATADKLGEAIDNLAKELASQEQTRIVTPKDGESFAISVQKMETDP